MNSHSFLASDDQQNHSYHSVLKATKNLKHQGQGNGESVSGDSYLRTCALRAAQQGDYMEAIALFNQLILDYPDSAIDYNNRGLVYFQCGEIYKALCDYNTALELNPKLSSAYNNRGNYYAACGELNAAIADYDQALDLNPSYTRAWINRGITMRDLGEYEQAIENLETALLFGQLESNIIAERGRTYHMLSLIHI